MIGKLKGTQGTPFSNDMEEEIASWTEKVIEETGEETEVEKPTLWACDVSCKERGTCELQLADEVNGPGSHKNTMSFCRREMIEDEINPRTLVWRHGCHWEITKIDLSLPSWRKASLYTGWDDQTVLNERYHIDVITELGSTLVNRKEMETRKSGLMAAVSWLLRSDLTLFSQKETWWPMAYLSRHGIITWTVVVHG